MTDSLWKDIKTITNLRGRDTWLGWKPFLHTDGTVASEAMPRIGYFDSGCGKWICNMEDHNAATGHRLVPFDPQPDYFCEGYIPPPPTA